MPFNSYIVCPIVSLQSYAAVIIVHYNYSRQEIWESWVSIKRRFIFLTMPTASGRRSGAVCSQKSPKTRLARIYCYGNTLYIVNLIY